MDIEQMTVVLERLSDSFKRIAEFIRRVIKQFVKNFKIAWAKSMVLRGSAEQRTRARIYLRTKSRRIMKKQWTYISPF